MSVNSSNRAGKGQPRPVDLPLRKLRLPIGGMVSFIHRSTGVVLVALIPVGLYLLERSLRGPADYEQVHALLTTRLAKFAVPLVALLLLQHFFSGVRHLLLDLDIGVAKTAARRSAWITLIASVIALSLLYGKLP